MGLTQWPCFTGICAAFLMASAAAAQAEEVAIELNATTNGNAACTLTFMVTNGHSVAIDQLIYETVLFDAEGQVDRLTLFVFGALPVGTPRVRQFAVPDLPCDQLSRVLFNGLHTCTAEGLDAETCGNGMIPTSRTEIEVLG